MCSVVSWISASLVDDRGEESAVGGTLLDPRSSTCSYSIGDENRESQSYYRIRLLLNERQRIHTFEASLTFLDLFLLATLTSSSTFLLPSLPGDAVDRAVGMFMKTDRVGASNPRIG